MFKGLLSSEEIAEIRNCCDEYFAEGGTHLGTVDFLQRPVLAALPFKRKIVEAIASVLGPDYVTINQFVVGANLHNPKWHRDSDNQGNVEYLYDSDYQVAKCGVYLQDNDPEWGGGLEVYPGSHKPTFLGHRSLISRPSRRGNMSGIQLRAIASRDRRLKPKWLPIKAGDVFLFHANLIHRASQPQPPFPAKLRGGYKNVQYVDPPPPREKFKYLIDWEVSPRNRHLPVYIQHQIGRVEKNSSDKLYRESIGTRYPQDYPDWLVEQIDHLDTEVVNYSDYVGTAEEDDSASATQAQNS
ncbi:MAG: phytanoyl-CoA dioxygenase family protein [Gammaproteobacteria bacterium]